MSESEFDAYLSLLGKLLHLSAKQRAQISDELRDHLEERFHALLDQGTPRDEALRAAVEELGDAAALAQQFTLPYHIRRRRQLMRYSLGSAVVIATTFVMAAFYWPANRPEPGVQLQAQDARRTTDTGLPPARKPSDLVSVQASKTASIRNDLTAKLEFRDFELKMDNVPWQDAIQFLSDVSDVDVLVDRRFVEETGIALDTAVQLKARQGALSVRSAMELILEQVAGMELAYAVRDGVILISAPDNAYENRVYDCRDLLEGVVVHQPGGVVGGGGGFGGGGAGGGHFQVRAEMLGAALQPTTMAQFGGGGGGGFGGEGGGGGGMGGGGMMQSVATSAAGPTLINVIQEATAPAHWVSRSGEGGTVTEYDGLLIVRHQPRVHHKIEELLDQIRTVRANKRSQIPQAGAQLGPATRQDDHAPRLPSNDTTDFGTGSDSPATIGAVLELGGADPKSVQLDTPVWLKTVTQVGGRGMTVYQEPHIQKIEGPGERPDTLRVLISGTAAMLSQIQKAHGGQSVTVWLKKPSERPGPGF